MPRFFVDKESIIECNGETHIIVKGEDAHHISRALRMAVGEKIEVCDFSSVVYECELIKFNEADVLAKVVNKSLASSEPKHKITLYQALPKGDKMETIIQKSTECGACRFVPFRSEFCIVKLDSKDGKAEWTCYNSRGLRAYGLQGGNRGCEKSITYNFL